MRQTKRKVQIIKNILERTRQSSEITLTEYMRDPDKFEIIRNGLIVEKIKIQKAQSDFRRNYNKVREFFD